MQLPCTAAEALVNCVDDKAAGPKPQQSFTTAGHCTSSISTPTVLQARKAEIAKRISRSVKLRWQDQDYRERVLRGIHMSIPNRATPRASMRAARAKGSGVAPRDAAGNAAALVQARARTEQRWNRLLAKLRELLKAQKLHADIASYVARVDRKVRVLQCCAEAGGGGVITHRHEQSKQARPAVQTATVNPSLPMHQPRMLLRRTRPSQPHFEGPPSSACKTPSHGVLKRVAVHLQPH